MYLIYRGGWIRGINTHMVKYVCAWKYHAHTSLRRQSSKWNWEFMASWYHKHVCYCKKKGCGVICFAFTQTDAGHGSIRPALLTYHTSLVTISRPFPGACYYCSKLHAVNKGNRSAIVLPCRKVNTWQTCGNNLKHESPAFFVVGRQLWVPVTTLWSVCF